MRCKEAGRQEFGVAYVTFQSFSVRTSLKVLAVVLYTLPEAPSHPDKPVLLDDDGQFSIFRTRVLFSVVDIRNP